MVRGALDPVHGGRPRDEFVELALALERIQPEDRHRDLARTRGEAHARRDLHRPQEPGPVLGGHAIGHERLAPEPAAHAASPPSWIIAPKTAARGILWTFSRCFGPIPGNAADRMLGGGKTLTSVMPSAAK